MMINPAKRPRNSFDVEDSCGKALGLHEICYLPACVRARGRLRVQVSTTDETITHLRKEVDDLKNKLAASSMNGVNTSMQLEKAKEEIITLKADLQKERCNMAALQDGFQQDLKLRQTIKDLEKLRSEKEKFNDILTMLEKKVLQGDTVIMDAANKPTEDKGWMEPLGRHYLKKTLEVLAQDF